MLSHGVLVTLQLFYVVELELWIERGEIGMDKSFGEQQVISDTK